MHSQGLARAPCTASKSWGAAQDHGGWACWLRAPPLLYPCSPRPGCKGADTSEGSGKNIDDTQTFKRYTKFFDKLRPISYTLKDNPAGNKLIGFGAQSVKQALLDSGLTGQDFDGYRHHGEDQYDSLCYTQFIPLNTYEIQQAKKRITDLETEILVLKETIDKLTAKLS